MLLGLQHFKRIILANTGSGGTYCNLSTQELEPGGS